MTKKELNEVLCDIRYMLFLVTEHIEEINNLKDYDFAFTNEAINCLLSNGLHMHKFLIETQMQYKNLLTLKENKKNG